MSLVALILITSQFTTPNNAYADVINTNLPYQYNNTELRCSGTGSCKVICDEDSSCAGATITCPQHFQCDITCSGIGSCENAEITCPYGRSCIVNCNNERSCQSTIINAQYSSEFILNDCSTGELTCNGMSLYFPPNNGGPRALINGADNLESKNGQQLHFYAIFGWLDINIINYNGDFHDNANAFMHCLPGYTDSCIFALDGWSCWWLDDACNNPPTVQPTNAPTSSPTFSPTQKPTRDPTQRPTMFPTPNPTHKPTIDPTPNPTYHPTFNPTSIPTTKPSLKPTTNPSIKPTQKPTNKPIVISNTSPPTIKNTTYAADNEYISPNESGLDQVDVLWLVTALLLSVLCFIMVILTYYIYHSRYKVNNNKAEMDRIKVPKQRKHTLSISNLRGLTGRHKSHISEHDQTKMNKLIISALSQNSNSKYAVPGKPTQLPKRNHRYKKHVHDDSMNMNMSKKTKRCETVREYPNEEIDEYESKEGTEHKALTNNLSLHVNGNPLSNKWNDMEIDMDIETKNTIPNHNAADTMVINVSEPSHTPSRSYNNNNNNNTAVAKNNPYPNGNLNQLHENSYSHSMRYYGDNNTPQQQQIHPPVAQRLKSVSDTINSPYSYLYKQKSGSIDGHNLYLTEPQIYSHGVGKLLYNHHLHQQQQQADALFSLQQQRNNNELSELVVIDDNNMEINNVNTVHNFGRNHPGFINTKLTANQSMSTSINININTNEREPLNNHKADDNSNANSQITMPTQLTHQTTLSVEIAANKILSPLSTVTASSLVPTDDNSDDEQHETETEQQTEHNIIKEIINGTQQDSDNTDSCSEHSVDNIMNVIDNTKALAAYQKTINAINDINKTAHMLTDAQVFTENETETECEMAEDDDDDNNDARSAASSSSNSSSNSSSGSSSSDSEETSVSQSGSGSGSGSVSQSGSQSGSSTHSHSRSSISDSGDDEEEEEDEELKRSEIGISSEQKLQEWITDSENDMDINNMNNEYISNNKPQLQMNNEYNNNNNNNNKYNYLHHQRNVTMVIKHHNNNTLPLSNIDVQPANIAVEPTQKVAITIGDNVYESPFNDEDHDHTVWTKHIYKNSLNTVNTMHTATSVSSKKTFGIECPVSVDNDHDHDNMADENENKNHSNNPTASTLEIQGLINV